MICFQPSGRENRGLKKFEILSLSVFQGYVACGEGSVLINERVRA